MKFSDVENKSIVDLIKQKNALVAKMFDMKMKNSLGQLGTTHLIKQTRRDLAKINTVLVRKAAR